MSFDQTKAKYFLSKNFTNDDVLVYTTSNQTIGGTKTFSSPVILSDTTTAVSSTTGALRCAGGAYFGAGCLFGSYLTTTDYFGFYNSNVRNCYFSSFPAGGGGRVFIDTQLSSAFDGTIRLPSLGAAATYTLPSATCTLLGDTGFTISSGSITLTNGTFNSTALGSLTNCAYSIGAANTGLYSSGVGFINIATAGTSRMQLSSAAVIVSPTLRLSTGGSAGTPGFAFNADTDTGIYTIADNNLGFSSGGTLRWDYNNSRINTTIPIHLPNGSTSAPSLTFTNDGANDTGLYWISDGNMGVSANGSNVATFSSSGLRAAGIGGNTGKRIVFIEYGETTAKNISSGGGTQSWTGSADQCDFATAAPTTTGMIVIINPYEGSGLDKLTYGSYGYSTTGFTIAAANPSGTNATSIKFRWVVYVIA